MKSQTRRHRSHTHLRRGFSLIELLVSVALFAVVMTASVGTLLALVDANQKAQSLKAVINNLQFALDSMARTIRTGRLYHCTNAVPPTLPTGTNDCAAGASAIVLTDDHGNRLAYRYNSSTHALERRDINSGSSWIALTAPQVVVEDAVFYVTGTPTTDGIQPTATMQIKGSAGPNPDTDSAFSIEVTVTQRVLDQ
ncbi:type II secretion system protein [Candidatus Kaiserbacteria bacterium]|nr:type II secretion system protein [Candidatus Kaiserbacteria bacterium]